MKGPQNGTQGALPRDDTAECSVLEAVLATPGALETVRAFLPADAFDNPDRRKIYAAALAVRDAGDEVDGSAILAWLRDRGEPWENLRVVLRGIIDGAASALWEQSARRLADLWRVRELARAGQSIWAKATSNMGDPVTFVADARSSLSAILDARQAEDDAGSLRESMIATFEQMHAAARSGGGLLGPSTGLPRLDDLTSGLQPGKLWIVGARPGHGKTALGMGIAVAAAEVEARNVGVYFQSTEMGRGELAARLCATIAEVDGRRVMSGRLSSEEWQAVTEAAKFLSDLPIYIDATSHVTVFDVKGRVRRHLEERLRKEEAPTRVVVVDYLQRVAAPHVKGRSREQEVAEIARELKHLAKSTKTCVIALAQVGRAVDKSSAPPTLSDLRESGNIEAEADVVAFIHHPNGHDSAGRSEIHIAKHRGGPLGVVPVDWAPKFTRFAEWKGTDPIPIDAARPAKRILNGGRKW